MSQVSVTNISVNVQNFQPGYNQLGLGAIPPGTTTDAAVSGLLKGLTSQLTKGWLSGFPDNTFDQVDTAIMSPWSDDIPGTAPSCVTGAISDDFNNWELPIDNDVITDMAKQITQEISNKGGDTGVFYGRNRIAGSETIYWGVAFTTAVVVDSPEQKGILYAFAAVLGTN